jgi:hypothetical protein
VASGLMTWLRTTMTWLRTTREGWATLWTAGAEFLILVAECMQKGIEGVLARLLEESDEVSAEFPGDFPLSTTDFVDLTTIHWELIAVGLGALLGSYVLAPQRRLNRYALLGPFGAAAGSMLVIDLCYLFWPWIPWIGSVWYRVIFTDVIGGIVLYFCIRGTMRMKT